MIIIFYIKKMMHIFQVIKMHSFINFFRGEFWGKPGHTRKIYL